MNKSRPALLELSKGLFCILTALVWTVSAQAEVRRVQLHSEAMEVSVTPNLGGRILSFSAPGHDNVLRYSSMVDELPIPTLSAFGDNIDYSGFIVWLGPQKEWWTWQDQNRQRLKDAAQWPPDPYTVLATNMLLTHSDKRVLLAGTESPLWGTRIDKQIEISADGQRLLVSATAQNLREEAIARDLWFNARVPNSARVFVPIAGPEDVRIEGGNDEGVVAPEVEFSRGMLVMENTALAQEVVARRGKLFINPSAGWMAAFVNEQLFLLTFALQDHDSIHAEQGQIEIYNDFVPSGDGAAGLIELEMHSPYTVLAPGDRMSASQWWQVFPYAGSNKLAEQQRFLQAHLPQ